VTDAEIDYEIGREVRAAWPTASWPARAARLAPDWRWPEIQQYAEMSASNRSNNLADQVAQAIYVLDTAFRSVHSTAPCEMVSVFWNCLDIREHLAQFCERLAHNAPAALSAIQLYVFRRLEVFAHPLSHTGCAGRVLESPAAVESRPRRGRRRKTPNCHPEVEPFLDQVSKRAGRQLTIREFCQVSGFADDTVFGFWRQGNTERCKEAHTKRFEKTLKLTPQEFLAKLAQVTANSR
jgi:hypothetical protein